jgi:hypothetical protein
MKRLVFFLAASVLTAQAGMNKLEAIGMIESGNNDRAIGSAGEISRYQIKPYIWKRYSASKAYNNSLVSTWVADQYMATLEETFQKQSGRVPDDFDRYVLWNAGPGYYESIGFERTRVNRLIRERAQRFVNLREMR